MNKMKKSEQNFIFSLTQIRDIFVAWKDVRQGTYGLVCAVQATSTCACLDELNVRTYKKWILMFKFIFGGAWKEKESKK